MKTTLFQKSVKYIDPNEKRSSAELFNLTGIYTRHIKRDGSAEVAALIVAVCCVIDTLRIQA